MAEDLMVDPLPDALQAAVENHTRLLANQPERSEKLQAVFETLLKWEPGDTITVAFMGGTPALHGQIMNAANEWTKHGNFSFDFGEKNGAFRSWSKTDTSYAADVRIGFDNVVQPGYWSLVGRNSVEPNIVGFGESSMNFGGFDVHLPGDFASTVMHEFGHALALQHEHASPAGGCDNEFRFDDDPGYQRTVDNFGQFIIDAAGKRPGIYTVLAGPPNRWSKAKVDRNLRQLPNSNAFDVGPFDKNSIMKYYFPEWMFIKGKASSCYSERNLKLSALDIAGIKKAYPLDESEKREMARRAREALTSAAESNVYDDLRLRIRDKLSKYAAIR